MDGWGDVSIRDNGLDFTAVVTHPLSMPGISVAFAIVTPTIPHLSNVNFYKERNLNKYLIGIAHNLEM